MRVATDDDNDGWFEVEERTDYVQAAIDRWRQERPSHPEPGVYPVIVNTRETGA